MRGKASISVIVSSKVGITPAYAGKSHIFQFLVPDQQDHPRLCGEKFEFYVDFAHDKGSPPPMRGKALHLPQNVSKSRITPAYAGKRLKTRTNVLLKRDHPRLCGEKAKTEHLHLHRTGSPPPMRGKAGDSCHGVAPCRITPAYAGKSI